MILQNRLKLFLAACSLTAFPGCFSVFYHDPIPPAEDRERCAQIEPLSRAKLYVFMFNGLDPFNSDTLGWTRDYLKGLGLSKIYCGQAYHEGMFVDEIVRLHGLSEDARFVVIGSDTGAEAARSLVQTVGDKGITTELLVYLQPRGLVFATPSSETPVHRILTIQGKSIWNKDAPALEGTENITLPNTGLYGVARHPVLLARLTEELTQMAEQIPNGLIPGEAFPPLNPDDLPVYPRNVAKNKTEAFDEWDFLKPTSGPRIRDAILMKRSSDDTVEQQKTP